MEKMEEKSKCQKKDRECLFSFAKINKYFIIPFLCPICCSICNYFIQRINADKGFKNKQCFLAIIETSTLIGGGFLYFISLFGGKTKKRKDKSKKNKNIKNSNKLIYNRSHNSNRQKLKIFSILFIMSLFVCFFDISEVYSFDKNAFEERLFLIFFISIFSQIILKMEIYNHQILSLSISLIGFLLLYIPIMKVITKDDILYNVLLLVSSSGFSLFLVLIKYLTDFYFISPYLCLLSIGTMSTLLSFIYFFIYSFIIQDLSFIKNSFDFSDLEMGKLVYLYIVIIIISGFLLQTFSFLAIYYFSPTLFMVTDNITPCLLWIIKIGDEDSFSNKFYKGLGYFIVLIASLIYNEIIICNFCNFNKYTKKYLERRQKEETLLLKKKESENSGYKDNDNDNGNNNDNVNNDESESDISYNSETKE